MKTKAIGYVITDPFDDTVICTGSLHYDRRYSARGEYHKRVAAIKKLVKDSCSNLLEGREPKCTVTFLR